MRLKEIYETRSPAISVEFFPPKTAAGEEHLESRIPEIKRLNPAFCSVTYGAGGGNGDKTLRWVQRLKNEFGLEVMCHLTCVNQSRDQVNAVLEQLKESGVENIIALRGDPPRGVDNWQPHPEGYHYAAELIAAAKALGNFSVAVAGFPEVNPQSQSRASDLHYLKEKVDAGADVVITQLFFDNQDFLRYVEEARELGIRVPIVPGILPFRSALDLERFTTIYARGLNGPARVPDDLRERITAAQGDEEAEKALGIAYATEQCRELLSLGVPGIHFFCMNESRAVEAILRNLELAGNLEPGGENKLRSS